MSNLIAFPTITAPVAAPVVSTAHYNESAKESAINDYDGLGLFSVDNHPLSGPFGELDNKRGLFVGDKLVNIVSPNYEVHQPLEVYKTFEKVADSHNLKIEKVLTNKHNGGLMISALYDKVSFLNEEHDVNLVFYTSHCGKYCTTLTLQALRLACFNQIPLLAKETNRHLIKEKHYKNALNIQSVGSALENIPASIQAYNVKAQKLIDTKLSYNDFCEWYIDQFKMNEEAKRFDSQIAEIKNIYHSGRGQRELHSTAYKAYQCVTFLNTHKVRNTANKNESVLFKNSDTSLKALDSLLAIA